MKNSVIAILAIIAVAIAILNLTGCTQQQPQEAMMNWDIDFEVTPGGAMPANLSPVEADLWDAVSTELANNPTDFKSVKAVKVKGTIKVVPDTGSEVDSRLLADIVFHPILKEEVEDK